jgi:hypothetical protein
MRKTEEITERAWSMEMRVTDVKDGNHCRMIVGKGER